MRARNMQSLTDGIKRRHPGVVIGGIGDPAHKKRRSSHNEDDTPGSLPEQEDADSNPEHRAIDVMLGPAFSKADAYDLINDVLADPAALARLMYILFNGWRWSRNTGWKRVEFDGDPHDDHIHFTGDAADDENAAAWPSVDGGDDMTKDESAKLSALFAAFYTGGPDCGPKVDPEYVVNRGNVPAVKEYANSVFSQLAQIRGDLKKVLAMPPGSADTDAIVDGVVSRLGAIQFVPDTDS